MEPVTQAGLLARLVRELPRLAGEAIKGFARWYWRLSLIGQFFAAMVIVPLINLGLAKLAIESQQRADLVLVVSVTLVGTMITATLAHGWGRKQEG